MMTPRAGLQAAWRFCTSVAVCLAAAVSAHAAASKLDALTVAPVAKLKEQIPVALQSTKPDFVVFVPQVTDAGVSDTGNEHFLVFDGPDGSLMAVWTQSTFEGQPDQHIVFAQSKDEGRTWTRPRIIAGPARAGQGLMASWGFPLVSKSGRIYVLYSQHVGKVDTFPHTTGKLDGIFSDDNGQTWSKPQTIPIPRSNRDNPDTSFPANFIVWQKPLRLSRDGRYLVGLTRWTSREVLRSPARTWHAHDARVEFIRFENVDANPAVADLKLSWFAANTNALTVPVPGQPDASACQEPGIVKLPDGRLFCVMRTFSGSPYWSQSQDDGETWTLPRPLLRKDGGAPLLHPLSPCPIFDLGGNTAGSGRYALFIHNHDGHYQGSRPTDSSLHRRPVYVVAGRFRPGGDQPVWFDEPRFFMDHDGTPLGPPEKRGRLDLALYSSLTLRQGKAVLWYPDRKFFLLGRILPTDLASDTPATGYFPLWRKTLPNYTDLALIYQGGTQRPQWTPDRFAPYVSYRDTQTGKEQWLFDSFLFIEFQDGRGHSYQPAPSALPAQRTHWLQLLERNFAPGDGLPVLEHVCRDATGRTGPPLRRRQVMLTMPVPIPGQTNWGELKGRALDFAKPADRLAACEWYLNTALEKWKALAPRELDLTGFYWVHESSAPADDFLPQVARLVHARGKIFSWIPYWHANGAPANWGALGFDVAWQQPNHFFRLELPDARLQEACNFARRHGMGLEMEFDGRLLSQPVTFGPRFNAYLDAFTRNGVKETAAIAYYEGGGAILQLANSEKPELRRHYDRLAKFVLHRQQLADDTSRRTR